MPIAADVIVFIFISFDYYAIEAVTAPQSFCSATILPSPCHAIATMPCRHFRYYYMILLHICHTLIALCYILCFRCCLLSSCCAFAAYAAKDTLSCHARRTAFRLCRYFAAAIIDAYFALLIFFRRDMLLMLRGFERVAAAAGAPLFIIKSDDAARLLLYAIDDMMLLPRHACRRHVTSPMR